MEIELKLVTTEDSITRLIKHVLPCLPGEIVESNQAIFNEYYDTPERQFGARKMGYRIRVIGNSIEQTIKTEGKVVGGLHKRPEFNTKLASNVPDLTKFPSDIWSGDLDPADLNKNLQSIFTTNFNRKILQVSTPESKFEIALDVGTVKAGSGAMPICEIELELKSGESKVLFDAAQIIASKVPVRLSNETKASLGYQLVNNKLPLLNQLPEFLVLRPQITTEEAFCLSIKLALDHWQHHQLVYSRTRRLRAISKIAESIELLRQSLSLYLPVLQCQPLLALHRKLLTLSEQWRWHETLIAIRKLRAKKGPFSRRVPKEPLIMNYLSGRREGLLSAKKPNELMMSELNRYVQLEASRMLIEKPWRQNGLNYNLPLTAHAKGWLSQGYQTVMHSLPQKSAMDHHNYLALDTLLRQTLTTGFLVADLFIETRGQFRAPWLDLLSGLDEIKALVFLLNALEEIDVEDKDEFRGWIGEKLKSVLGVMEKSRQIAMSADVYW